MKSIILIRHAKSSWEDFLKDSDRDIIQKGVDNSFKVALKSKNLINSNYVFWSSPAKRANKTARLFLKNWNIPEDKIEIINDLYTFNLNQLELIVKSCPNTTNNLILFGHNGAITDFVNKFGNIKIDNVPTSGLVSYSF